MRCRSRFSSSPNPQTCSGNIETISMDILPEKANSNCPKHSFSAVRRYHFSVWARADKKAVLSVRLLDASGAAVSNVENEGK